MLGKLIGFGGFSRVFEYIQEDKPDCWIKIIASGKKISPEKAAGIVFNEGMAMEQIGSHPNIVKLIGTYPASSIEVGGNEYNASYLLLEKWANGSLANVIKNTGPLEENIARFIFMQIWTVIKFIHEKGFAHLDIKLENILLDEFFNIKISDFGTAEYVDDCFGFTSKEWGTKGYMAPEITSTDRDDNFDAYTADCFSLGVCLNLLLTGQFPSENQMVPKYFTTNSSDESMSDESECDKMEWKILEESSTIYDTLSEDLKILLDEMLDEDPCNRLSIYDVVKSEWFKHSFPDNIASLVFEEMSARIQHIENSKSVSLYNF